ncbi:MAG: flagellar type III secretion system protein FliR [Methylobacteriaceae bacterium]|nr:flagellar type III secretion system protein FliR [Methylobacteriaceae bacterium]
MTIPIPDLATAFMLVFARVGTLVMLLPAIGEQLIPARLRLGFALLLTLTLLPLASGLLPRTAAPDRAIAMLLGEVLVGLILGLATRMVLAALQTAGAVIAQELGLASALTVDPTTRSGQEAAIGNLLTLLGITLVFATDTHHLAITAVRDSYALLPPASLPEAGDAAKLAVGAVGAAFALALKLAAPFILFAFLFNLGLGVLSRLIPQIQVFFVGIPLSILIGMLVLLVSVAAMMTLFVGDLGRFLQTFGVS